MESLVPTAFWTFSVLHICFGSVGLVAFWVPIISRKGGDAHKRWGKVFTLMMLVTGAAGGIGRAIAHALARDGAAIGIVDLPGADPGRAAEELRTHGLRAEGVAGDVADAASISAAAARVAERLGPVDILGRDADGVTVALDEGTTGADATGPTCATGDTSGTTGAGTSAGGSASST